MFAVKGFGSVEVLSILSVACLALFWFARWGPRRGMASGLRRSWRITAVHRHSLMPKGWFTRRHLTDYTAARLDLAFHLLWPLFAAVVVAIASIWIIRNR